MSYSQFDINNKKSREELRRLFVMKKTELQSMLLRGCSITDAHTIEGRNYVPINYTNPDFINMTFEEFIVWRQSSGRFPNRISFTSYYYYYKENVRQKLLVIYIDTAEDKKVLVTDTILLYALIETAEFRTIICISKNGFGPGEMTKLKTQIGTHITFQFFTDLELAFNRANFALAPIEVQVYLPNAVKEFEEREGLNRKQLPLLLVNDQIAKLYGASVDSVVQTVICGSESAIQGYYRFVRASSEK